MGKARRLFHRKARGIRITQLMARDGTCCALCGLPLDRHIKNPLDPQYITFDHLTPVSRGGTDDLDNLQLAHAACNHERGSDALDAMVG